MRSAFLVLALALGQEKPDLEKLIAELGASEAKVWDDARSRLVALGEPALEALQKALYHEDAEVRVRAKEAMRAIRKSLQLRPRVEPVLQAVRKVRARWTARDFKEFEPVVRESFQPAELRYVHYVPMLEVGNQLESDNEQESRGFRPFTANGGRRDLLTRPIAEALNRGDGIVFLKSPQEMAEYAEVVIFTLPDKKGWTAYVVVQLPAPKAAAVEGKPYEAAKYTSRLLAQSEGRVVWGMDPAEVEWAAGNWERVLDGDLELSKSAAGGFRIDRIAAGSIASARGLQVGDVVKDVNGKAFDSLADVRAALGSATATSLRIHLERGDKPVILEFRLLQK